MLTKKEIKVLELRKKGLNQGEIAKKLKIKQPSVSLFEKNIKRKFIEFKEMSALLKEKNVKIDKNGDIKF